MPQGWIGFSAGPKEENDENARHGSPQVAAGDARRGDGRYNPPPRRALSARPRRPSPTGPAVSKKNKKKKDQGGGAAAETAPAATDAPDAPGGAPAPGASEATAATAATADRAASPDAPMMLKAIVFLCGAGIMSLEITGSRLLAPHFGNSVYVWSALIGLFMGALATGYYGGGNLADKMPRFSLLGVIVATAAVLVMMLPLVASPVCHALSGLGLRWGPLTASAILFFAPSALLGMVSPFSVKLATRDITKVGRVAGRLYALSTVGSIFGTLFTAFFLIPTLGVNNIVKLTGGALLVTAILAILADRQRAARATPGSTMAGLGAISFLCLGFAAAPPTPVAPISSTDRLLIETDSAYHHIAVVDTDDCYCHVGNPPPGGCRYLQFDNYRESGIHLVKPYDSAAEYSEMFDLAWLLEDEIESVLFIGGGGGLGPRVWARRYPKVKRLDLVEIDPEVVEVAKRFFYFEEKGPVKAHVEDGRMFVRSRPDEQWDVAILDAFTIGGRIPPHLVTAEYFDELRAQLHPERGILMANINASLEGDKSLIYRAVVRTMRHVFEGAEEPGRELSGERRGRVHVFPKPSWWAGPRDTRNIFVVATVTDRFAGEKLPPIRDALARKASGIADEIRGDALEAGGDESWAQFFELQRADRYLEFAQSYLTTPVETHDVPLLTDDFAPIEDMAF